MSVVLICCNSLVAVGHPSLLHAVCDSGNTRKHELYVASLPLDPS